VLKNRRVSNENQNSKVQNEKATIFISEIEIELFF
jgi:hypothetical protein